MEDAVREFRFVRRLRDSIDDDRLLILILVAVVVPVAVGLVLQLLLLLISDCWRRRKLGFDTFIAHEGCIGIYRYDIVYR